MLSAELRQLLSGHIPTGLRAQARQHQCQNIILQIPQEPRKRLLKNKTITVTILVNHLEEQTRLEKLSPCPRKGTKAAK